LAKTPALTPPASDVINDDQKGVGRRPSGGEDPRFAFEKFPRCDPTLTTETTSMAGAMAIDRTFKESLQKWLRSLETGCSGMGGEGNIGASARKFMASAPSSEWAKFQGPSFDKANQEWVVFLLKRAKQRGWFRLCIKHGLLAERYRHWPDHNFIKQPKVKVAEGESSSVRTISGGALEQKRYKH